MLLLVGCVLGIHNPLEGDVAHKICIYQKYFIPNTSDKVLIKFHSYGIYLWKNLRSPGSISTAPPPHTFCPPSVTSVPRKWKKILYDYYIIVVKTCLFMWPPNILIMLTMSPREIGLLFGNYILADFLNCILKLYMNIFF